MTETRVVYDSNNSGGDWWLKDEHWEALERAGWSVFWVTHEKNQYGLAPKRSFTRPDEPGDWLGAQADAAVSPPGYDLKTAIDEFERLTGQDASDEGCNCCGPPHSFQLVLDEIRGDHEGDEPIPYMFKSAPGDFDETYVSGEEVLAVKYGPLGALSKEELVRRLARSS